MDEQLSKQEIERLIDEKIRKTIGQYNILPDQIKSRHIGEGVRYVRSGTAANRPTSGEKAGAIYLSTDTDSLSLWNGTSWVSETLT